MLIIRLYTAQNMIHLESCTWQKLNRDSCLSCPNSSYGTGNKCTREIIIGLNASFQEFMHV
jgi:hypothetical protein